MDCPDCQTPMLQFPVDDEYREHVPEGASGAALCPTCLVLEPDDNPPAEPPDFEAVGDAFPTSADAAVPMALGIGLLTSLALYRSEISALFSVVEEAGADPMLVLDRLAATGSVDSQIDLRGRKRQLEQLLE